MMFICVDLGYISILDLVTLNVFMFYNGHMIRSHSRRIESSTVGKSCPCSCIVVTWCRWMHIAQQCWAIWTHLFSAFNHLVLVIFLSIYYQIANVLNGWAINCVLDVYWLLTNRVLNKCYKYIYKPQMCRIIGFIFLIAVADPGQCCQQIIRKTAAHGSQVTQFPVCPLKLHWQSLGQQTAAPGSKVAQFHGLAGQRW